MINKCKRKILHFHILFYSVWLFIGIPAYSQWFQRESGTESQLNSVFFLDSLNGWVVGDDSTVLRTTNGGEDWNSIQSSFNYDYNDIYFSSDSVGWLVGEKGFYEGVLLRR